MVVINIQRRGLVDTGPTLLSYNPMKGIHPGMHDRKEVDRPYQKCNPVSGQLRPWLEADDNLHSVWLLKEKVNPHWTKITSSEPQHFSYSVFNMLFKIQGG